MPIDRSERLGEVLTGLKLSITGGSAGPSLLMYGIAIGAVVTVLGALIEGLKSNEVNQRTASKSGHQTVCAIGYHCGNDDWLSLRP